MRRLLLAIKPFPAVPLRRGRPGRCLCRCDSHSCIRIQHVHRACAFLRCSVIFTPPGHTGNRLLAAPAIVVEAGVDHQPDRPALLRLKQPEIAAGIVEKPMRPARFPGWRPRDRAPGIEGRGPCSTRRSRQTAGRPEDPSAGWLRHRPDAWPGLRRCRGDHFPAGSGWTAT